MEIQLIYGPNGSGKSLYAETEAAAAGKSLVYLATMVAQNEENLRRIKKHRIQRQNKGFRTVEQGWEIQNIRVTAEDTVLLEDVSNLLANGMFAHGGTADQALEQILALAQRCRRMVIVTIQGLQEDGYDAETAAYIRALNRLNEALAVRACSVTEMRDGVPMKIK